MNTKHYENDRSKREAIIRRIGEGEDFQEFVVDRGHRNGAELHVITTNGIIKIFNIRTKRLVTKLIARPGQIKRYYYNTMYKMPLDIINKAREHEMQGLNFA